jgi:predicted dehydrogenase
VNRVTTNAQTVGWGVLGPGRIARSFAADLLVVPGARLVATGSRDEQRAAAFAAEFGGRSHGSYEALVADPEVDVVYVATPHVAHAEHTRLALEAGKAVLCEKPMTLDAATTSALFAEAAERGLFLMEAMWMACHPTIRTLLRLLADGEHGTARQVQASIGFVVPGATDGGGQTGRLLDPALGGGALLDMGIYPLTFAHLVLGEPEQLTAVAHLSTLGIDLDVSVAGLHPRGATSAVTATLSSQPSVTATVATEKGCFELPRPFYSPSRVRWTSYDEPGSDQWIEPDEPVLGLGYGNEILEVQRCLREGAQTSALVPPEQTISVMGQMDRILEMIGVSYRR